jgi:sugar (pentulose or hexulose) kinase
MRVLAMDFGTSSIKLSILDADCLILKSLKIPYQIRVYNEDWVELDGDVIIDAMVLGIRSLDVELQSIDLIAFDTFSPSMIFMDIDGDPVYPIFTHLDRRSKKQSKDILERVGKDRFQTITGIQPFIGGASITSAMWMRENENELFKKAFNLGHLNTYIYRKLTGVFCTDIVNASMTGMYQTVLGAGWSEEICEICEIPKNLLPRILTPGAIAGFLTKEIAGLTGLREGIPVALGTNDAASAQIGANNVVSGDILNISGSSEMISILTDKPKIDDQYYLRCSATPSLWQIFATTVGGFALDWFREQFYQDLDERTFFDKEFPHVVDNFLDKTRVGFLPYLAGDRQSLIPKTGSFTGLTLNSKREDFLAAILLGMHSPIQTVIQTCESFIELNKTIKLTGGMIDPVFLKVKEKLFGGYQFKIISDCPIIGSVRLALAGLEKIERK